MKRSTYPNGWLHEMYDDARSMISNQISQMVFEHKGHKCKDGDIERCLADRIAKWGNR